ncbi:MAG: hypothetical protein H6Q99_3812, partial [Proteobacteria bacterium]|nr:hypothetical protein [Pseudomonadota bacterium]
LAVTAKGEGLKVQASTVAKAIRDAVGIDAATARTMQADLNAIRDRIHGR